MANNTTPEPARSRMDSVPMGTYSGQEIQGEADMLKASGVGATESPMDYSYSDDQYAANRAFAEREAAEAAAVVGDYEAVRLDAAHKPYMLGALNPANWKNNLKYGPGAKPKMAKTGEVDADGNAIYEELNKNSRREGFDSTDRTSLDMWNQEHGAAHEKAVRSRVKLARLFGIPGAGALDKGSEQLFQMHEILHSQAAAAGEAGPTRGCSNQACRDARATKEEKGQRFTKRDFMGAHTEVGQHEDRIQEQVLRQAQNAPYQNVTEEEFKSNPRFRHIGRMYALSQWLKTPVDAIRKSLTSGRSSQQAKRAEKYETTVQKVGEDIAKHDKWASQGLGGIIKEGKTFDFSSGVQPKSWMTALDDDSVMKQTEALYNANKKATGLSRRRNDAVTQIMSGVGYSALPEELDKKGVSKDEQRAWLADNPEAVLASKKERIVVRDVKEARLRLARDITLTGDEGLITHAEELADASKTSLTKARQLVDQQKAVDLSDETRRRPKTNMFGTPEGARNPVYQQNIDEDAEKAGRIVAKLPGVLLDMAAEHKGNSSAVAAPLILPSEEKAYRAEAKAQNLPKGMASKTVAASKAASNQSRLINVDPEAIFSAMTETHHDLEGTPITAIKPGEGATSKLGASIAKGYRAEQVHQLGSAQGPAMTPSSFDARQAGPQEPAAPKKRGKGGRQFQTSTEPTE